MLGWLFRLIFVRILGRWALGLMALWGLLKVVRGSDERVRADGHASGRTSGRSRGRSRR